MKKIIIINEDGSRDEFPGVIGYGLAAVTSENVCKRMDVECSSMDVLILAGNLAAIVEEMAEAMGAGKEEVENMKEVVRHFENGKDGGDDEDQN